MSNKKNCCCRPINFVDIGTARLGNWRDSGFALYSTMMRLRSIQGAIVDNEGSSYVCRSDEQYGDSNWRDTLPDGGPDHLSAVGGDALLLTETPAPQDAVDLIVPMLCVGMPHWTLRVCSWDAERPLMHSHAERGNESAAQKKRHRPSSLWRFFNTATAYTVCRYQLYSRSEMECSNSSSSLSLQATKISMYLGSMYLAITSLSSNSRRASRRLFGRLCSFCS